MSTMDRDAKLRDVLGNAVKRNSFVDFCNREHCSENLKLYIAICDFDKAATDEERLKQAKSIVRTYIRPGASAEVNMTDEMRAALQERVASGDTPPDVFAQLKEAAFKDMSGDTMPRFVKSDLYEEAQRATASGGGTLVHASLVWEDVVTRLRKKRFLGLKLKQRHSKADIKSFEALGAEMRKGVHKAGFLMKRGDSHQSWKRRWCILCPQGLGYFLDEYRFAPKGVVLAHEMEGVEADLDSELGLKFCFGVKTASRTYVIQAANQRDRQRWVRALATAIFSPTMVPAPSKK